jgi:hypothetical protein
MTLDVPPEGCYHNYIQGGPRHLRERRQLRQAGGGLDLGDAADGVREGACAGPERLPPLRQHGRRPSRDWAYLRIVKRTVGGEETYRAYTSRDGFT